MYDAAAKPSLGRRALLERDALLLQQALQLARLKHFADDVAAADEFALDVQLRDRGPFGIGLDALAQIVRFEHVQALIAHAEMIENLHYLPGKSAHRKLRRALHEQHHVVALDLIVDELLDGHRIPHLSAARTRRASHVDLYVA